MKRVWKNILMILALFIIIGATIFTMYYAKQNLVNASVLENAGLGEPPSMNQTGSTQSTGGNVDMTPPSMNENSSMSTTIGIMGEPPEKPDGETGSTMGEEQMPTMSQEVKLTTTYYVIVGVEALLASLIITYILLSQFNKQTFKETYYSPDKIVITILLVLLLTIGFSCLNVFITNNYFLNSESNNGETSGGSSGSSSITYTSVKEITSDETITSGTYSSNTSDENAILVNGEADVSLSNIIVSKSGDSDGGDNTSFYGINSAILAKGRANLIIKNATITTSATGANGVFSYGGSATTNNSSNDGTKVSISDSSITTTADNAGGIMTTGGGITNATDLTITTSGTSSAAIRSDRGGGTVTIDGGTYTTNGKGSPAIYSTANITAKNAKLISNVSEGIVIEGANSVEIDSCTLSDSNTELNGQSTTYKNIFLYQSMSGDADSGNAVFSANASEITTTNGDTIYVTNTTATINLTNNTITNKGKDGNFLRAKSDSWGTSGSNGGNVAFIMTNQSAKGNIVIDSISSLNMNMTNDSYYEGTINEDNKASSLVITLDKTSSIKLTGTSYVTSLEDKDTSYSNINFNGYKLYVNGKSIN